MHPLEISQKREEILKRVSTNLKNFRWGTIHSQRTIAEALECDMRWYQRLESGRHEPSIETLARLAVIFNVDVSEFFNQPTKQRSVKCL